MQGKRFLSLSVFLYISPTKRIWSGGTFNAIINCRQATFVPSADAHDTSYFMSRYIWNPEDENVNGGSDFYELSESGSASCSSSSYSNLQDEAV